MDNWALSLGRLLNRNNFMPYSRQSRLNLIINMWHMEMLETSCKLRKPLWQSSRFAIPLCWSFSWSYYTLGKWLENIITWVEFMNFSACSGSIHHIAESMAGHRAHKLLGMLQNALAFGYSELEPHPEPLKVWPISYVLLILWYKDCSRTSTRMRKSTLMIQIAASSFLDWNPFLMKPSLPTDLRLVYWMHIWKLFASHGKTMIHVGSALKLTGWKTYRHTWRI